MTPHLDKLAEILNDDTQPKSERDRAAEILRWSVDRKKADPELCDFAIELDVSCLWDDTDIWQLKDVEKDGKTTRQCVQVRRPLRYVVKKAEVAHELP